MKLRRTNIEQQLSRLKDPNREGEILEEVRNILSREFEKDERIREELSSRSAVPSNAFEFDLLETSRIYHIEQIKKICIDYRLRFLDSSYFKSKIPPSALAEIKEMEKAHGIEMKGYKIMAPSRLFKLEDKDDPLLFAPIGNNYYYLVHKWGNDLHPLRRVFAWPFKSVVNLAMVVVLVSYLLTLLVPDGLFTKSGSSTEFWIIFFFMFKSLASVVIFYGFALGKNFNPAIWNSKYFNA